MLDVPLLIGGQSCPARDGRTFERRHPVTGEVVSRVAAAALEDADAAVAAAKEAFPTWAALSRGRYASTVAISLGVAMFAFAFVQRLTARAAG